MDAATLIEPAARWRDLGPMEYRAALDLQRRIAVERLRNRRPDTLLLLEHPPTITLGRRAGSGDLLRDEVELARSGVSVFRVDRGGAATYHGPGQLIGYPVVRLERGGRGARRYVTAIEEMLCDAVAAFGVSPHRRPGMPGVWVGEAKIASIGVAIRRGITQHGFALNVDMDLAAFSAIVPCGVRGLEWIDLSRCCGARIELHEARSAVIASWRRRFGAIEQEEVYELERYD